MNLIRLFFAIALWPGIYATVLFLARTLQLSIWGSPSFPWMGPAAFGSGFLAACLSFFFLPRPKGIYVLGHELTHALAIWLSGGKVHSLHAGEQGGKVVADRVSPVISLAPYVLPFYPIVLGILWLAITRLWPGLSSYALFFLGLWGVVWGYHYAFTANLLPTRQPDFLVYGRIFSISLIVLGNLMVVGLLLWFTLKPFPAKQGLLQLGFEWVRIYTTLAYEISGLLLRYLPRPD